jgi:hypothetical protein
VKLNFLWNYESGVESNHNYCGRYHSRSWKINNFKLIIFIFIFGFVLSMWKLILGYAIRKWSCAIWVLNIHIHTFASRSWYGTSFLCTHYSPPSKRKTTPSLHNGPVFHHTTIVPELNSCMNYQVSTWGNQVPHGNVICQCFAKERVRK